MAVCSEYLNGELTCKSFLFFGLSFTNITFLAENNLRFDQSHSEKV
jgi:hypothetical protein